MYPNVIKCGLIEVEPTVVLKFRTWLKLAVFNLKILKHFSSQPTCIQPPPQKDKQTQTTAHAHR